MAVTEGSRIKNPYYAKQLIDFQGLDLDGGLYPTDIDALIEYHDMEYILVEVKYKNKRVEISRFKGLGEMMPNQLKETTMSPKTRRLIRVDLPPRTDEGAEDTEKTRTIVSELMGKKPEFRFKFITEHAQFVKDLFV